MPPSGSRQRQRQRVRLQAKLGTGARRHRIAGELHEFPAIGSGGHSSRPSAGPSHGSGHSVLRGSARPIPGDSAGSLLKQSAGAVCLLQRTGASPAGRFAAFADRIELHGTARSGSAGARSPRSPPPLFSGPGAPQPAPTPSPCARVPALPAGRRSPGLPARTPHRRIRSLSSLCCGLSRRRWRHGPSHWPVRRSPARTRAARKRYRGGCKLAPRRPAVGIRVGFRQQLALRPRPRDTASSTARRFKGIRRRPSGSGRWRRDGQRARTNGATGPTVRRQHLRGNRRLPFRWIPRSPSCPARPPKCMVSDCRPVTTPLTEGAGASRDRPRCGSGRPAALRKPDRGLRSRRRSGAPEVAASPGRR